MLDLTLTPSASPALSHRIDRLPAICRPIEAPPQSPLRLSLLSPQDTLQAIVLSSFPETRCRDAVMP